MADNIANNTQTNNTEIPAKSTQTTTTSSNDVLVQGSYGQPVQASSADTTDTKTKTSKGGKMKLLIVYGFVAVAVLSGLVVAVLMNRSNGNGGGVEVTPTPAPGGEAVATNANGKIAFIRRPDIYSVDLATLQEQKIGTIPRLSENENTEVDELIWSEDAGLISFIVRDTKTDESAVQVMRVSDGTVLDVLLTTALDPIYTFTWIPGSLDVMISYADTVQQAGLDLQKYYLGKLSVLGFPGTKQFVDWVRPIVELQIAGDSGYIYFLDEADELWRVPLDGGRFLPVLRGVAGFDLSDDETKLVYERRADGEIWVSRDDGSNPRQITQTSEDRMAAYGIGGRSSPLWGPDNISIVFTESGANYQGFGLVNEDSTGLRSVADNAISPKIIYDEYYSRFLSDLIWLSNDQIGFVGHVREEASGGTSDDFYLIGLSSGEYQELFRDVLKPSWTGR